MNDHRKSGALLPIVVTLAVLLLAGYVGAYYKAVFRHPDVKDPIYPVGRMIHPVGSDLGRFFAPMHWLDRRIRPNVWEPTP